jgi:hypothetical protein
MTETTESMIDGEEPSAAGGTPAVGDGGTSAADARPSTAKKASAKKAPARKAAKKAAKKAPTKKAAKRITSGGPAPKYPRHSLEKALRVPRALIDQNAGRPATREEAFVLPAVQG